MEETERYSLIALGKTGSITIEVLRREDNGCLLSIQSSGWCFDFSLLHMGAVSELAAFLRSYSGREEYAEMAVGSFGEMTVRVIKDIEFGDRLYIRAGGAGVMVEFTLVGGTADEFMDAIKEAAKELADSE